MHHQDHPSYAYQHTHESEYTHKPVAMKHETFQKEVYHHPESTYQVQHQPQTYQVHHPETVYHAEHTPTHKETYKFAHQEPLSHESHLKEKLMHMRPDQYHHWEHESHHDEAFKYPFYSTKKHDQVEKKEAELTAQIELEKRKAHDLE